MSCQQLLCSTQRWTTAAAVSSPVQLHEVLSATEQLEPKMMVTVPSSPVHLLVLEPSLAMLLVASWPCTQVAALSVYLCPGATRTAAHCSAAHCWLGSDVSAVARASSRNMAAAQILSPSAGSQAETCMQGRHSAPRAGAWVAKGPACCSQRPPAPAQQPLHLTHSCARSSLAEASNDCRAPASTARALSASSKQHPCCRANCSLT